MCSLSRLNLAFILLFVFLVSSCSQKDEIVIGFVGGLSGRIADLGIAGRNGVVLAVEEVNAKGGINGHHLQLIVADDKQDPETATREVVRLIDQGVVAIIGHMTSSMTVLSVPIVNEKGVVMVSPTATSTSLSGKEDNFFRVIGTTKQYATVSARRLYNMLNLRNVSVVYDLNNVDYTLPYYIDFRSAFESLGGTVAVGVGFRAEPDTSFFENATTAISEKTDGVLLITSAMDSALFAQQIKKINPNIAIATSEWAATEKLIEIGGEAVEGVYFQQFFNRNSTDQKYTQFKDRYVKRFGNEPGFASVGGYDAAHLIFDGLKRQKKDQLLRDAVRSIKSIDGLQGKVSIDRYGDSYRPVFPSFVQNGKLVVTQEFIH